MTHTNVCTNHMYMYIYRCCPKGKLAYEGDMYEGDIYSWLDTELVDTDKIKFAKEVCSTLKEFFARDDQNIENKHITEKILRVFSPPYTDDDVVAQARRIWDRMTSTDPKDHNVKMSHDGMLSEITGILFLRKLCFCSFSYL